MHFDVFNVNNVAYLAGANNWQSSEKVNLNVQFGMRIAQMNFVIISMSFWYIDYFEMDFELHSRNQYHQHQRQHQQQQNVGRGAWASVALFAVASKLNTRNCKCSWRYEGESKNAWFLMRFSPFSVSVFFLHQRMHPHSIYGSQLYQCLVRGPQFIGIICMLTICCFNGNALISIDSTPNKRDGSSYSSSSLRLML